MQSRVELQPRSIGVVRILRDGTRALLTTFYPPANGAWAHDFRRGVTRRAYSGRDMTWAVWGPGEDQLTVSDSREDGTPFVGWLDVGGSEGSIREIERPPGAQFVGLSEWSPDGEHLVCVVTLNNEESRIAAWSEADGWRMLTDDPEHDEGWPTVSPDGKWLAYRSDESGRDQIYVRRFLQDGRVIQVTDEGGRSPLWSPDGTELFYRRRGEPGSDERSVYSVAVEMTEGRISFGRPEKRFDATGLGGTSPVRGRDISPDGRIYTTREIEDAELWTRTQDDLFPDRLRLIQNWTSRLGN